MRHQDRNFGIGQDRSRRTAKDHLPQTALGISALDDQVRVQICGFLKITLPASAADRRPGTTFRSA